MARRDTHPVWHAWGPALVLMALGATGYLVTLGWVSDESSLWQLDDPILEWFAAHRTMAMTSFMVAVSWVFGPVVLPILVAIGGAIWGVRTGQWFNVAVVVGSMLAAAALSFILKIVVNRPRPSIEYWQEPGGASLASFPSGHTLCAATLVLVTGYLAWRTDRSLKVLVWWSVGAVFITATVAISRLYLGYHFLTDVIAGTFCAVFVLGIAVGVVRTHDARLRDRAVASPSRA